MQNQQGFVGVGVLIAILVGLAVLGGGAYYVVHQQSAAQTPVENFDNVQQLPTKTTTSNPTPKQLTTTSPAPATDTNASWKTYRNSKFSFELKYPSDITVHEESGSNPQIGDDWVRVVFRNEQDNFGLVFFAGHSSTGGAGEGYSSFQTKSITVAGKQVQESLSAPDGGTSDDVLLSVYTQRGENRYDNFYSTFKRSQMATFVPRIEAIVATLKYTDSAPSTSTGTKTYVNSQYGFSFQYPQGMSVQASGYGSIRAISSEAPVAYILIDDGLQTEGYITFNVTSLANCEPGASPANASINGANFWRSDKGQADANGFERHYVGLKKMCYIIQLTSFPSACVNSGCENRQWSATTMQNVLNRLDTIAQTFRFTN